MIVIPGTKQLGHSMKRLLAAIRLAGAFAVAALWAPSAALAHPGLEHIHGAISGFAHPFTGLDHMLVTVAIGVLAAQLGGRALSLVPLAFIATMAAAGALAIAGYEIPHVEGGIALSALAVGAAIALRLNVTTATATTAAALFAVFHGQAHGVEMPPSLSGLGYGVGFIAATALLHGVGMGGFLLIARPQSLAGQAAMRIIGAIAALAGTMMLIRAA